MTPETKAAYVNYLARAIKFTEEETGLKWPGNAILVTQSYEDLAELDEIAGIKIYVTQISSSYDFFIAFPSEEPNRDLLLRAFDEFCDLYNIEF